jgi:predicted aldo/keto reductase-like oxidoreductase
MIYKDFKDKKLSTLGLGCMRLPVIDGDENKIDVEKAEEMFAYALENGVNYFDTAWGYHGGNSEEVTGQILRKYPRDSYYIASKFPGYDLSNMGKVEEIFEAQLAKTGMEYFDFYMLHNVCELNIEQYLDEKNGIIVTKPDVIENIAEEILGNLQREE